MPYSVNTLVPKGQLSDSQPELLANYTAINDLIGVDHANFASGNFGFHNKLTLPQQDPMAIVPGTTAGYVNILSRAQTGIEGNVLGEVAHFSGSVIEGFLNFAIANVQQQSIKLPSSVYIRTISTTLIANNPTGDYFFQWPGSPGFVTQYWAIIIPSTLNTNNTVFYVRDVSAPQQIRFTAYMQEGNVNVPIANLNNNVSIIAIGV